MTPREAEVLRALEGHAPNAEVAAKLGISVRTVESHVSSLLTKFGVADRAGLVGIARAADHSWIYQVEPPAALMRTSRAGRFVGRASEMRALLDDWRLVVQGEQRVVLVSGEAGIGKTRLCSEFVARIVKDGGTAMYGRCDDERGDPLETLRVALGPYLAACPAAELERDLGDLIGELNVLAASASVDLPRVEGADLVDANALRVRIFEAIRRLLVGASNRTPLVLVLDDLQKASEQTLRLLRYLVKEGSPGKTMVLCAHTDPIEINEDIRHFLADASMAGVYRAIQLSGLQRLEVAQLLTDPEDSAALSSDPMALDIYAETKGNPFFATQLIRDMRERVEAAAAGRSGHIPSGVNEVVAHRVSRLSETTQRVLYMASILGQQFDVPVLQQLVEMDDDSLMFALEEAVGSHLLDDITGGSNAVTVERFAFTHAIVRRSLLRGLSPARRRRLHAAAARAIEATHSESLAAHADEIAGHLVEAGQVTDQRDIFTYLMMAGRAALASAAPEEALRLFDRLAPLRGQASPEELAELTFQKGMALRSVGRWADAIDSWSESLEIAAELNDVESISRTGRAVGHNLVWAMRPTEAASLLGDAIAQVDSAPAERARMLGARSFAQAWAGDFEGSAKSISLEMEIAESLDSDELRAHALAMTTQQLPAFFGHERAVAAGYRALDTLRASGDLWTLTSMLGFMNYELIGLGRIDEAEAIGAELAPLAERIGNFASLQQHLRMSAMLSFFRSGDLRELGAFAMKDHNLSLTVGLGVLEHALAWQGMARFLAGDWESARVLLNDAVRIEPPTAMVGWGLSSLLEFQAYSGDTRGAEELWSTNHALVARAGQVNTCGGWTMAVTGAEALAVLGDFKGSHELYPIVLECLTETNLVCMEYRGGKLLQKSAGVAAAAGGMWDAAEDHFQRALHDAERMPHVVERAHSLRLYGSMLLETGTKADRSRAIDLLGQAEDLYTSFRMPRFRELCRVRRAGRPLGHA